MAKQEYAHDLDEFVQHALGEEGIRTIVDWVTRFSYWVAPALYEEVRVVFPRTRRLRSGEEKRSVVDGVAVWANEPASYAFWKAFGADPTPYSPRKYRNFVLCHIYEGSAYDSSHFTNLANLTVFPRCLESFSEWTPIRAVLEWHSYKLYGYTGPKGVVPAEPSYYPSFWSGVSDLEPQEVHRLATRLRELGTSRPTFYTKAVAQERGSS